MSDWPSEMAADEYRRMMGLDEPGDPIEATTDELPQLRKQARKWRSSAHRDYEAALLLHIKAAGLPDPEQQFRFHDERRWLADFAWLEQRVICEVDGGTFGRFVECATCGTYPAKQRLKDGRLISIRLGGRHNTGVGYENDAEKLNEAAAAGWTVIRVTPAMVDDGRAVGWLRRVLEDTSDK